MTPSDYIASVSLILALTAFIYSYVTNTKKYELTNQYRTELIAWYSETINILIRLKTEARSHYKDDNLKRELLSRLSAKIETGRFYFPNIDKGDTFGSEKPLAYRGYRNLMLDFLVFSFQIYEKQDALNYIRHAEVLQKNFTSHMFEILDSNAFLKDTERLTEKTFSKALSFEDFLNKQPDLLNDYL